MVYLSKIYTKSGDNGETSLGDGTRVPKDHPRVEAFGAVDELNSILGVLRSTVSDFPEYELIAEISNDLFDVGGDLCIPLPEAGAEDTALRITAQQVQRLEAAIDRLNAPLAPLRSFILPGGTPASAWCHLARTVCRRAERRVISLQAVQPVNPQLPIYLNRLSDLLFVLARSLNDNGTRDVLWQPGRNT